MAAAWISVGSLSKRLGISRRAATKLLGRAAAGHPWHGHTLDVRATHGRGGRSGLAYEVSSESLRRALGEPSEEPSPFYLPVPSAEPRASALADQRATTAQRFAAIEGAIGHPPGSPERLAAIAAAVARGTPDRTVRRWLTAYEAHGLAGLGNRRPANAGAARVVVSREFDKAYAAAGYDAAQLAALGKVAERSIKGLWAGRGGAAGYNAVRRDAGSLLFEACEAQGTPIPERTCTLSRRTVERFRHYSIVNQRRNDRKAYDDAKPRIRRSWSHMAPMDVIVADVKPLDIIVTRNDGTPGWPRAIGFLDAGTGRLFLYIVLCNKGEGVRQEHVNEAFIAMVMHPEWGFPRAIYTDNGSELKGLEKIRPALELVNAPGARTIIYAKPYNASAKPIESMFARLDKLVTPVFEGYAGANRMTKKTQTVGKPPAPYPHAFERFAAEFTALVEDMNHTPFTSGERKGRSAAEIFAGHCEAGWRPIAVDQLEIDFAFSERRELAVRGGAVSIKGVRFTHPDLPGAPGRKVPVAIPWRRGCDPLFNTGRGWAYMEADDLFPADWIDGARESHRRQRTQDRAVAALERSAPAIDPAAVRISRQARRAKAKVLPAVIPMDTGLAPLAQGGRAARQRQAAELTEAQRQRLMQDRETAALLRQESTNAA